METSLHLPSPEPGETLEVLGLLEAGARSWAEGQTDEALRHFSHAAEAAGEAGDDRRALALARSVAELRDRLARASAEGSEATAPPPGVRPSPPSMKPPPSPSAQAKARSIPPPAPSSRAAAVAPPPRAASVPPKLPSSAPSPSAPPPQASTPSRSAPPQPSATLPTTPPIPEPTAGRTPEPASVLPKAAPEPARAASSAPGQPLRVSVKSSVRDPDLLVVRVLRKDQPAPPGTREAILTAVDAAVDLASAQP